VHRNLPGRCFETVIRYSVKLAEAASHGVPITRYAKESAGYADYRRLAEEVLAQESASASAPLATPEGVLFTVAAPQALLVQIAGDFNNWNPERTHMEPIGPIWRLVLPLPPGRYRYRYVIDGQWLTDPLNPLFEPSPYSGDDSLVVVGEPEPATAGGFDGAP
jgi:chromosome partitioning protein